MMNKRPPKSTSPIVNATANAMIIDFRNNPITENTDLNTNPIILNINIISSLRVRRTLLQT